MTVSHRSRLALIAMLVPSLLLAAPAKPKRTAFFQSLAVPGWGQYTLGRKNAALFFFGSELIMIGGIFSFRAYGASARADYEALAARYAGVVGGHGHDFYVDVGNWMSVDDFNEQRLRERNFDQLYVLDSDRWRWDTDQHRAEMRTRRIKSDRAFNSVIYLIGGLALNHIASAIHAGRASVTQDVSEANPRKEPAWSVGLHPAGAYDGLRVSLTREF